MLHKIFWFLRWTHFIVKIVLLLIPYQENIYEIIEVGIQSKR